VFQVDIDPSLQSDSTRAANLELKIQSRLTSELEKIANQEQERLFSSTHAQAASEKDASDEPPSFLLDPTGEKSRKQQLSHDSVSQEIEILRNKLAMRKKLEQPDPEVDKARDNLVQCLRLNDRRPLDCWEEKEKFKREVARLEKSFVDKTIS